METNKTPERIELPGGYSLEPFKCESGEWDGYDLCSPDGVLGFDAVGLEQVKDFAAAMNAAALQAQVLSVGEALDEALAALTGACAAFPELRNMANVDHAIKLLEQAGQHRPTTPASAVQPAVGDEEPSSINNLDVTGLEFKATYTNGFLCLGWWDGFKLVHGVQLNAENAEITKATLSAHTQHTTALEAEVARLREALQNVVLSEEGRLDRVETAHMIATAALASRKDNADTGGGRMQPRIFKWELSVTLSDNSKHTREVLGSVMAGPTALGLFVDYLTQDNDLFPIHLVATPINESPNP